MFSCAEGNKMSNLVIKIFSRLLHTLLASVHELTGVHALSSDEELLLGTMLMSLTELNNCQRSTTTRIVDDGLDDTLRNEANVLENEDNNAVKTK